MNQLAEKKIVKLLEQHELAIQKLADFVPDKQKKDLEYALIHECYVGSRIALCSKNYQLFQQLIKRCKKSEFTFGAVYSLFCVFTEMPRLLDYLYHALRVSINTLRR